MRDLCRCCAGWSHGDSSEWGAVGLHLARCGSVHMNLVALVPAQALGQVAGLASTFFTVHLHYPPLPLIALPFVLKETLAFLFYCQIVACVGQSACPSLSSSDQGCLWGAFPLLWSISKSENYLSVLQYIVLICSHEKFRCILPREEGIVKEKAEIREEMKLQNSGGNEIT